MTRALVRKDRLQGAGLDGALPYLLLAPSLLVVMAVLLYPLIDGLRASTKFYRYGKPLRDVGLDNYVQLWSDPQFINSLLVTVGFVASAVIFETILGFALALFCSREIAGIRFMRTILIIPMVITPVVVAIVFRLIYASDAGMLTAISQSFGGGAVEILGRPVRAFVGLVALDVWEWTPLMFLILLAGLQSLPVEPLEAARVDGAGGWRLFWDHTLPMMRPILAVAIVLRTIDAFGTFDQVFVLTRGGPGEATRLLSIFGYDTAFKFQQTGYAAALFVTMGLIILAFTMAAVRLLKKVEAEMTRLWARYAVMGLVISIVLLPIYWMVAAAFKTNKEITQDATLYPHAPTFDNFTRLFAAKDFGHFLLNSIVITTVSVFLALVFGSLGAYAIARFRLPFGLDRHIGLSLLVMRIVPPVVILIPVFLFILKLNLIDSWFGLIITYTALNVTYCVWMMESFFREIPVDLEEAAMVDGDSRFGAFRRIVLPMAAPGMVATSIFAIIVTFNEFMFALVLTSTPRAMTMPRGTATLIGRIDTDWASMSAAGVLGALPIVIFAFMVQRHLVRGLTLGAVK